jgi:penicillin-binding protein 2
MVGLVGRLISLQINQATKYKSLSDKNRFREWKLAPERGAIKDFLIQEIASNEPLYQVHLVPENTKDLDNLFVRLKAILNITDKKVSYLKRVIKKQKPWEPVIVSENLNWSDFSRINLFLHELEGVEPIVSVARTYPDNSSAHILGYVSQISAKDLKQKNI